MGFEIIAWNSKSNSYSGNAVFFLPWNQAHQAAGGEYGSGKKPERDKY
jgi:hypothetical protein